MQAGVAFPADAQPAEVVQPGGCSFHHVPPSARGRVPSRGGCSGGRSPVSRSATARDGACRGHCWDRRSQIECSDLVAERQGQPTCGVAPPAVSIAMATKKRQTTPAICRNAGETGAKSGKTRTPATVTIQGFPAYRPGSDVTAARLKIVVSPVRVRISPLRGAESRMGVRCSTCRWNAGRAGGSGTRYGRDVAVSSHWPRHVAKGLQYRNSGPSRGEHRGGPKRPLAFSSLSASSARDARGEGPRDQRRSR